MRSLAAVPPLPRPETSSLPPGYNAFTGTIRYVRIDIGDDDVSYKLDEQLVFNAMMAQQ
jgi:hypothetical protein